MSLTRRDVLRRLGLGAAMLPLLELHEGQAQSAAPRKRLAIVFTEQGTVQSQFWPRDPATIAERYPTQKLPRSNVLTELAFPEISAALEPHKASLLMLGGLRISSFRDEGKGGGHEAGLALLTGRRYSEFTDTSFSPGDISVDQYIANGLAQQIVLPFKSINLLANTDFYAPPCMTTVSAFGRDQMNLPERNPQKAFARLFADIDPNDTGAARRRALRQSVLDHVVGNLQSLKTNLGTADQLAVQRHLDAVRELERQLEVVPLDCSNPVAPEWNHELDESHRTDFVDKSDAIYQELVAAMPVMIKSHFDLVVNAFACDLTRVAVVHLGHSGSGLGTLDPGWPGLDIGGSYIDHHIEVTHGGYDKASGTDRKVKVEAWVMSKVAYFIERLKSTPEPGASDGSSMLDHTVVLHVNSMGNGAAHGVDAVPWFIAGGAWYFKQDYLFKGGDWANPDIPAFSYADFNPPNFQNHNGVLIALCNAMGIAPPQVDGQQYFGDPSYGGEPSDWRAA